MSDSINLQVPAEHLALLATLLEELNSKETKEKLINVDDVFWQKVLCSLDISPTRSSKDKLAKLTEEERFSLVMSYRQEAEKLFKERQGVCSSFIRGVNLVGLAKGYSKQKLFDKAENCLKEAISSHHCFEAANALIELPGFDISRDNIRLAISSLAQIENDPEARLKAIELATRYGSDRLVKAELAKIFFSDDPTAKNEASCQILTETGVTDYPELAAFMARKFTSSGNDFKAFYWWGVALRCYPPPDPAEVLSFTKYITGKYQDPGKRFYVPDTCRQKLSLKKVESYYLLAYALQNMFTRRRYEACFDFLLQLAEKSRAEKIKYPSLHEDVALILLIRKQYSLFIEERILFIDSVEADSDFISSTRDVLSGTQAPEAYLDTVIERKCRDIRLALGKHWQECGQWWEAILSSKHPKRFKTLFDFPSQDILLPAYINSVPKDKICEIYRLTGATRSGSRDWLEP